jgi:hypothetical protein
MVKNHGFQKGPVDFGINPSSTHHSAGQLILSPLPLLLLDLPFQFFHLKNTSWDHPWNRSIPRVRFVKNGMEWWNLQYISSFSQEL